MKFRITKAVNTFDGLSPIYRVYELRGDNASLRAGFGTETLAREYVGRLINPPEDSAETVIAEIDG
jgi:hypothetical protein